ncbi:hypothetical protein ACNQ1M_01455 [Mycoplasma sp. VS424B]|uniref:hypothetical protein n=1 Tax=Mycoplasma TaxID=2093 RepID=UPI003A86D6E9
MQFNEIRDTIISQLQSNNYDYDILDEASDNKITQCNDKQIPYCNLIIQIKSPIKRILFIDMNYQDNYVYKVNPNNKTIPKVNKQTNKYTRKNSKWLEYIPHYLSQFENALFIKIVYQFKYERTKDNSWMKYLKLLNFESLKAGEFINIIK